MVEYNFPNLKKHFQRYNDAPYQVVIEVDYNEDTPPRAFASGPSLQYHYIASPTGKIPVPIVYRTNKENFTDHEQIIKDIQKSYMKQGRKANRLTSTRTGFHFTLSSMGGVDGPLSDYVYRSIKESLEDVLGPLRK